MNAIQDYAWLVTVLLQCMTVFLVKVIDTRAKRIHHEVNSKSTAMISALADLKEKNAALRVDAAVNKEQADQEEQKDKSP